MSDGMNEKELIDQIITRFESLQRIKSAVDRDAEIAYQEKLLRTRMQSFGIVIEDLELK